uniref:Uncharacterized protein n=1 Tax=Rhizophagus irregularis (strain DAOM 181602 / DAOM 197198 / MUCL 43194) TaxID=747089 RepID=U9TW08_RHIID
MILEIEPVPFFVSSFELKLELVTRLFRFLFFEDSLGILDNLRECEMDKKNKRKADENKHRLSIFANEYASPGDRLFSPYTINITPSHKILNLNQNKTSYIIIYKSIFGNIVICGQNSRTSM